MAASLKNIRNRMPAILDGLEVLCTAAKEVRMLKRAGSGDYANAILGQNGYGGDTAEIYFHRFAPRGAPSPSDQVAFQALRSDPEKSRVYESACYQRWNQGITAVQRVVAKYGGEVEVEGFLLGEFLTAVKNSSQTPNHRVHVKISVPGQVNLRKLREIVNE